jgi:membrane-bound lytic murein transglycosylase A
MKKIHYLILLFSIILITIITLSLSLKWFPTEKTKPKPNKPITKKIILKKAEFAQLPGWTSKHIQPSFRAFQESCKTFLRQDPEKEVGTNIIKLHVKDWQPACRAAMIKNNYTPKEAKLFFETWFIPAEYHNNKPVHGLFTGYFMPLLQGHSHQTNTYNVPIYGVPSSMITANLSLFKKEFKNKRIVGRREGNTLLPFYTREQINQGALKNKAPVLFWVNDPMDRLFLEIEGSGAIDLVNGKRVYVGYAGENGAPYTSIAGVLIKEGIMTPDNASSKNIKEYLQAHPKEINRVLNKNESFVFFQTLKNDSAYGAQGVPLTPGYSLAVDKTWVPYGTPTWLSTTISDEHQKTKPFNRLMVAQDTGGAIRGTVRGDVFWGAGKKASFLANHMRNEGRYWLLLPRQAMIALS